MCNKLYKVTSYCDQAMYMHALYSSLPCLASAARPHVYLYIIDKFNVTIKVTDVYIHINVYNTTSHNITYNFYS